MVCIYRDRLRRKAACEPFRKIIVRNVILKICPVDVVITSSPEVTKKNQVSGYKGLSVLTEILKLFYNAFPEFPVSFLFSGISGSP